MRSYFLNIIFTIISTFISIESLADANPRRLLLSELRGGDHAHAGDTEAIDMVIRKVLSLNPSVKSGSVVDVGCGFGGTLNYMKHKGFNHLYGVDIDKNAIDYAKAKYRGIEFIHGDALSISSYFQGQKFDLFTFFSSIYAMHDKQKVLLELAEIAHPGAIVAIFDYSVDNCDKPLLVLDFGGKPMMPVCLKQIKLDLASTGWEFVESQDLSKRYIGWYSDFLAKLYAREKILEGKYTKEVISSVYDTFAYFVKELRSGKMGGIVVYARKK